MIRYQYEDGDLLIRGVEDGAESVFTSDRHGAYNVNRAIVWAMEHGESIAAHLDVSHVLRTLLDIDLDTEHLLALTEISDEELMRLTTLLYIDVGDGTHMLIDGNHRLSAIASRAARNGQSMIVCNALVISMADAQQFRVRYYVVQNGAEEEIDSVAVLKIIEGTYSRPDGSMRDTRTATRESL